MVWWILFGAFVILGLLIGFELYMANVVSRLMK